MTAIEKIKTDMGIMAMAQKLGLDLDARNGKATCNCPNCDDTGKHLTIYEGSNRFYCFKCQVKGDQIDLYTLFTGNSPKTAIAELSASGLHRTPPQHQNSQKQADREPVFTRDAHKDYSTLFYEIIANQDITKSGREYLNKRGITDALILKYGITSIDDPRQFAYNLKAKYPLNDLLGSGLFDYSKNEKPYCSFFYPAILFPHWAYDITKIVYLSTRNLTGDAKSFKLHNTPGHPFPGQEALHSKQIFIFEGIINGLSYEVLTGKENWIAIGGLITPEKFEAFKLQFPNQKLILGLDPDEAGKQALSQIESCTYINWTAFAAELGFKGLQHHPTGKAYDLNDYLIMRKK